MLRIAFGTTTAIWAASVGTLDMLGAAAGGVVDKEVARWVVGVGDSGDRVGEMAIV